ncbi:hypothetical protein [Amycolatopsis sp. H20-H5]|uniref:hypothetical protein n=1 Tax=Amycolatopsis sp. H20-H5 TaxID=3046309 RepID=UPI002DB86CC0|nr:hypothetical protein [Amycolatopsis sp. H20-H5]MEC3982756.1 hypothetical protein [Amycolatopsis sp. H20-H5]
MTTTLEPRQHTIPKARLVACYAAILGTFPYLTLKVSWLTGGTIGLLDPSFVDSPVLRGANLLTGGMDAVAILLAFALTYAWGRRIPAAVILFPAWIASGLLAPIVLTSPVIAADLFAPSKAGLPLADWVWAVVYGGFAWQGIALFTAFVLYARDRWSRLPGVSLRPGPLSAAGLAGVVVAIGTGSTHLAWAFGSTVALAPDRASTGLSAHFLDGVFGVASLLTVVALLSAGRLWPRLVTVWIGAGMMVGWGGWLLVTSLGGGPIGAGGTGPQVAIYGAQVVGGALLMVELFRRVPRQA